MYKPAAPKPKPKAKSVNWVSQAVKAHKQSADVVDAAKKEKEKKEADFVRMEEANADANNKGAKKQKLS